jgi:hypothetical protein
MLCKLKWFHNERRLVGGSAKTLENPTGITDAPKEARQDELAVHHLFRNQAEELSPQNSSP